MYLTTSLPNPKGFVAARLNINGSLISSFRLACIIRPVSQDQIQKLRQRPRIAKPGLVRVLKTACSSGNNRVGPLECHLSSGWGSLDGSAARCDLLPERPPATLDHAAQVFAGVISKTSRQQGTIISHNWVRPRYFADHPL